MTYAQPRGWSYASDEAPGAEPLEPDERQVTLPAGLRSASAARRFTRATLREWHLDPLVDVAVLIASELVTNAILHGAPDAGREHDAPEHVQLAWHRQASRVTCIVTDCNPGPPVLKQAEPDAEGGRGLQVVQTLAAAWGWLSLGPAHKAVWAALSEAIDR